MNPKGCQRSNNHRIDKHLCKNHTHQLVSLVKENPEPHPVLGNKRASNLSQAVNELRTVIQVLSQLDSCMQGNEVSGSYIALALDKMTFKIF
jgi:hypothetical protein